MFGCWLDTDGVRVYALEREWRLPEVLQRLSHSDLQTFLFVLNWLASSPPLLLLLLLRLCCSLLCHCTVLFTTSRCQKSCLSSWEISPTSCVSVFFFPPLTIHFPFQPLYFSLTYSYSDLVTFFPITSSCLLAYLAFFSLFFVLVGFFPFFCWFLCHLFFLLTFPLQFSFFIHLSKSWQSIWIKKILILSF